MKRFIKIFSFIIFLNVIFLTNVRAVGYYTVDDNVNSNEEVKHSYFIAGNEVEESSKVDGISAVVGNSVSVRGIADYSIVAGNNIDIKNTVNKDLFVAGNVIRIDKESILKRDIFIAGSDVTIDCDIVGNVFIAADNVKINSNYVSGDLKIKANSIVVSKDTSISGTLNYNEDANLDLKTTNVVQVTTYEVEKESSKDNVTNYIISIVSIIIVAYVLIYFLPNSFNKVNEIKGKDIFNYSWTGLIFLIVVPVLSIFALVTTIGIPIAVILLLIYGILVYLSSIYSSLYIGNKLTMLVLKEEKSIYINMLVGLILTKLISLIPVIGGIYTFIMMLFGLGILYKNISSLKNAK